MSAASGVLPVLILNPADGVVAGQITWTEPHAVAATAAALRGAQSEWQHRGAQGRAAVLAEFARWLVSNRPELESLLITETGKSASDAALEIPMITQVIAYYASHAEEFLAPEKRRSSSVAVAHKRVSVGWEPRQLIGIISPWNYPVANPLMDAVPALAAGCAVLLKPAEQTPLTIEAIVAGWRECGGPPVLGTATGGAEVGEAVIDCVDFIQFTGSSKTGRLVMARAAQRLTPVSLELGGKDPMLVLADADIARAASGAVWGAMFNAGQTCVSVERAYVHDAVYPQFVDAVVREVSALRLGSGPDYDVGAMIDDRQLQVVERHVQDALARGATALTGGRRSARPGFFYEPTVLVDVDHSMACMTEETFGPTLPIMRVSDDDEAIRLANESPYGLSATVWTKDIDRAKQVAAQLDCGAVNINDVIVNLMSLTAPHGGWKDSGLGARLGGAAGLRKFCHTKAVVTSRFNAGTEPNWYSAPGPLQRFTGRLLTGAALAKLRRT